MITVDFVYNNFHKSTPAEEIYIDSEEVSSYIDVIARDILVDLIHLRWINPEIGKVVAAEGRENVGFNLYDTNLETIFYKEDDTYILDEETSSRFTDNNSVSSATEKRNTAQMLRVRYGNKVLSAFASRLLSVYFDIDFIENSLAIESNPSYDFQYLFIKQWWIFYAYRYVMELVEKGIIKV